MHIFLDLDKNKDKGIIKSDYLENIREAFSEKDDKAGLKKRLFNNRFIPERKYAITPAGRFDIGLLPNIVEYLRTLKTPFKLIMSEEFKIRYNSAYDQTDTTIYEVPNEKYRLRDYQLEGLKRALKHGCGTFIYPTGSGKTLLIANTIENIRKRNPKAKILIVTLAHLVSQFYTDFVNYGMNPKDISRWSGDDDLDTNSPIVICGPQIIYNKIKNLSINVKKVKVVHLHAKRQLQTNTNLTPKERDELQRIVIESGKDLIKLETKQDINETVQNYFESVTDFFMDEVHMNKKDNIINDIFTYIKTKHRFGYTGTLPEDKIDQWNIIGKIGPVLLTIERELLVEQNAITDVDIRVLKLWHKEMPDYYGINDVADDIDEEDNEDAERKPYQIELEFLRKSAFRNNTIKKIAEKLDKNTLIVVDRIEHGEILKTLLTNSLPNKKVYFIQGSVEEEERTVIKKLMEKEDNIICIAIARIFTTGISINNLHYIIFASVGKAKVSIIQAIGRGVRTLSGKVKVVIFDLADMVRYGTRHLEKRLKIYETERLRYKTIDIREN